MTTNEPSTHVTATIVYESMFGATRNVAEAIADGIRSVAHVDVLAVHEAVALDPADLLIVGAPTHAHALSRPQTRADAANWVEKPASHLRLEPDFDGDGVREWLPTAPIPVRGFAAFDTRADMPRLFTGSAAAGIDKRLRKRGAVPLADYRSFLVDKDSALLPGQLDEAEQWGRLLGARLLESDATRT